MKRLVVFSLILVVLTSCHNYKKEAKMLTLQRDSIESEAFFRDSIIGEALNDFNEIQAALDSIKVLEQMVSVQSAMGNEMSRKRKLQIIDDIALLNKLIQKNKEQTAALQNKLNNSSYRTGKLNTTIAELDKMVKTLEEQVADRDADIFALSNEVSKLNIDISTLTQKITQIENENEQKTSTINSQIQEMNKVYYAYGSAKELKEAKVIEKAGGLLGIGKTAKIIKDFNRDYFTEVDVRNFDFIPLNVKKAEIVSVHQLGSFHISGEKTADTLFIDNKEEFWKASKYLVIVTK